MDNDSQLPHNESTVFFRKMLKTGVRLLLSDVVHSTLLCFVLSTCSILSRTGRIVGPESNFLHIHTSSIQSRVSIMLVNQRISGHFKSRSCLLQK